MRTLISCLLISLLSFGLMINEASAKRFGGGRSFGVQRSQSSLFSGNKAQNSAAFTQRTKHPNKWGGILGGVLIGGLLSSLFMGHGFANGILTWMCVAGLAFFLVSLCRKKMQPGLQSGSVNPFMEQKPFNYFSQSFANSRANEYPADFIPEHFLRAARVSFNRLQAAYDQKNLSDLKEFTAPEVFAEIKMQLDERGDEPNKTEIITLEAELLDMSRQANSMIASVRFTGSTKENDAPISQFDEIWHFRQFATHQKWVVGGIQQSDECILERC